MATDLKSTHPLNDPKGLTTKASPLSDGYIPYHVNDKTGFADGLLKTDVDNAISATVSSHTQGTDTALGTLGTQNPPLDADLFIYRASASAWALVTATVTQIKAYLKTYFDTLYFSIAGQYYFAAAVNDDGTQVLPTVTANYPAHGFIHVCTTTAIVESTEFEYGSDGNVQIIRGTANVVVNADTDGKVCLGTAADQNPLTIKNRLGGVRQVMITLWYK